MNHVAAQHEEVMERRTHATRGIINNVNDLGAAQTLDVTTHTGATRTDVEVHQIWGLATNPPAGGAVTVLIANGSDPSDMIALQAAVPFARMGGLAPGETAIYGSDGTRIHIKQGGIVEILAAMQVNIQAPNVSITTTGLSNAGTGTTITGTFNVAGETTLTGSVTITGDASITGNLSVDGSIDCTADITAEGSITGGDG